MNARIRNTKTHWHVWKVKDNHKEMIGFITNPDEKDNLIKTYQFKVEDYMVLKSAWAEEQHSFGGLVNGVSKNIAAAMALRAIELEGEFEEMKKIFERITGESLTDWCTDPPEKA